MAEDRYVSSHKLVVDRGDDANTLSRFWRARSEHNAQMIALRLNEQHLTILSLQKQLEGVREILRKRGSE